ncbi:Astra associated protein 1 Asa1 [Savitreella phatthalungensis]
MDNAPPTPLFILRGHAGEVQSLHWSEGCLIVEDSTGQRKRTIDILTGDVEGYVVAWSLSNLRPCAIWKAHDKSVIGLHVWRDTIVTHGRDNKLRQWRFVPGVLLSRNLPIDTKNDLPKPFLVASLDVNALNFCSMACQSWRDELLVSVPGLLGSAYIDVFSMPRAHRIATRITPPPSPAGKAPVAEGRNSVTALDIDYPHLVAGYEDGSVALFHLDLSAVDPTQQRQDGIWLCTSRWHRAHKETVLSVRFAIRADSDDRPHPDAIRGDQILSAGIDDNLMRFRFSRDAGGDDDGRFVERQDQTATKTGHFGQGSLAIRQDKCLILTAGWDGKVRIFTGNHLEQVAVLKWHRASPRR